MASSAALRENQVKIVEENHLSFSETLALDTPSIREKLERRLCDATSADRVDIERTERLSNGAIQENWALSVVIGGGTNAGRHAWTLRTDAPSAVAASLSRAQEYAMLQSAHAAGVKVSAPLFFVPR